LTQVFGTRLSTRLPKRSLVSGTVVVENQRVVDGDIRDALFKVAHRIATRGHHIVKQLVGLRDGASRTVDKVGLDSAPSLDKSSTIGGSERPDVQAVHALCALVQHGFRCPPVSAFFYGARIFGSAELRAKSFGPAFPNRK
jgi:hypothetical protein